MSEWKECTLGDIITFKNGKKRPEALGPYPVYGGNGILAHISEYNNENCIAIGRVGAYCGSLYYEKNKCWISDNAIVAIPKEENNVLFCYYLLKTLHLNQKCIGTGQPLLTQVILNRIETAVPPLAEQQRIASILSSLDDKIELNNAINKNLEEQAQTLFKNWFVDFAPFGGVMPEGWKNIQAQDFFDISIGKTPPRKEQELFSETKSDDNMKWISISDMGSCGTYISDSSEYLTKEAIEKYNVKIIPDNTVILSFKLTVGRIAITDGEMTSNEAIAHFCTDNKEINEYLYCYLKNFSFATMGSTSSIATAVNSKIIKAMPFVLPSKKAIDEFHKVAKPLFDAIKTHQLETQKTTTLRDTLLPKLMSGENRKD